jgi:hypothetical protein
MDSMEYMYISIMGHDTSRPCAAQKEERAFNFKVTITQTATPPQPEAFKPTSTADRPRKFTMKWVPKANATQTVRHPSLPSYASSSPHPPCIRPIDPISAHASLCPVSAGLLLPCVPALEPSCPHGPDGAAPGCGGA